MTLLTHTITRLLLSDRHVHTHTRASLLLPLLFITPVCVQVFSMFLETLVDFIVLHRDDLQDWLFVLLTQLLKKMGADLLGSVQAKVQKALDVTRLGVKVNYLHLRLE